MKGSSRTFLWIAGVGLTVVLFSLVLSSTFDTVQHASAQKPRLATYRETLQVLVDTEVNNQVSTQVSLFSTSTQEMRVPPEVKEMVIQNQKIASLVVTNEDTCVPGVVNSNCIMINLSTDSFEGKTKEALQKGKDIANPVIDQLSKFFDVDPQYHSTFAHPGNDLEKRLETQGKIAGKGVVSVVYTISKSSPDFFYTTLETKLVPKLIRDEGGFAKAARKLSEHNNSTTTFSMTPKQNDTLLQIQVSVDKPLDTVGNSSMTVNPLQLSGIDSLERSGYFSSGFFPLNSLVQVYILSEKPIKLVDHGGQVVDTVQRGGERMPSDLTQDGWIFDKTGEYNLVARYLFGKDTSVNKEELWLSFEKSSTSSPIGNEGLPGSSTSNGKQEANDMLPETGRQGALSFFSSQFGTVVIAGIGIAAAAIGSSWFFVINKRKTDGKKTTSSQSKRKRKSKN